THEVFAPTISQDDTFNLKPSGLRFEKFKILFAHPLLCPFLVSFGCPSNPTRAKGTPNPHSGGLPNGLPMTRWAFQSEKNCSLGYQRRASGQNSFNSFRCRLARELGSLAMPISLMPARLRALLLRVLIQPAHKLCSHERTRPLV